MSRLGTSARALLAFLLTVALASFALALPASSASASTAAPAASPSLSSCIACIGGVRRETRKVSGPVYYSKRHVRDLTTAWAKASSYTWSQSTTVSSTLSASIGVSASGVSSTIGVTSSTTQSWGVSVTIPATKTRYSKLALRSDYNRYYVKSRTVVGGKAGAWKYAYLYSPVKGRQYLMVKYQ